MSFLLLLRSRALLSFGDVVRLLFIMRARRLLVVQDPLTRAMAVYLADVALEIERGRRSVGEIPARGDLAADLERGPGTGDRRQPLAFNRRFLDHPPSFAGMPDGVRITSLNYCPAGGGVGWHTDSGVPGWRVYVVRTLDGAAGQFLHTGGAFDDDARIAHAFYVSATRPLSWHAVRARGVRMSLGVRVGTGIAKRMGLGA